MQVSVPLRDQTATTPAAFGTYEVEVREQFLKGCLLEIGVSQVALDASALNGFVCVLSMERTSEMAASRITSPMLRPPSAYRNIFQEVKELPLRFGLFHRRRLPVSLILTSPAVIGICEFLRG